MKSVLWRLKMARKKINLDALPSNNLDSSNVKDLSPVTSGQVKTARSGGFAHEVRNIGNSLFEEIILPAIKSAIVDFFSNGVSMVMFGANGQPSRRGRGQHRSYNKMYG